MHKGYHPGISSEKNNRERTIKIQLVILNLISQFGNNISMLNHKPYPT